MVGPPLVGAVGLGLATAKVHSVRVGPQRTLHARAAAARAAPESFVISAAFTPAMDAAGWWEVEVPTPLGRLRFDVHIHEDGEVSSTYRGHAIPVPAMQTSTEGDGVRVRWTQRLTFPVRVDVGLDALVVGDRLTGIATAGSLMSPARLEGRRVS